MSAVDLGTLGVDADDQLGVTFSITKMYTANWGIELLAALPYEHDIMVDGLPGTAATVTHLPPTLRSCGVAAPRRR